MKARRSTVCNICTFFICSYNYPYLFKVFINLTQPDIVVQSRNSLYLNVCDGIRSTWMSLTEFALPECLWRPSQKASSWWQLRRVGWRMWQVGVRWTGNTEIWRVPLKCRWQQNRWCSSWWCGSPGNTNRRIPTRPTSWLKPGRSKIERKINCYQSIARRKSVTTTRPTSWLINRQNNYRHFLCLWSPSYVSGPLK